MNIAHDDDGVMKSVDFENIQGWENVNEEVLLVNKDPCEVAQAKKRELENWSKHKVYVDN